MEAAFTKLQKDGKNDVDNLIKWMKDSKVIDQSKEQEDKVRSYFNDVPDKKNVPLEKFKEVTQKVAQEFKTDLDGISKKLGETAPKLMDAVSGAASTLTSAARDLLPSKK